MPNKKADKTPKLDEEMINFLDGVVGVVEADSFARHVLWKENRDREKPRLWDQNLSGFGQTVGFVKKMPVCISLLTATVDGRKVLFVHPTSVVVDHRMIDKWLKKSLPETAFRSDEYINRTDATNFHAIF